MFRRALPLVGLMLAMLAVFVAPASAAQHPGPDGTVTLTNDYSNPTAPNPVRPIVVGDQVTFTASVSCTQECPSGSTRRYAFYVDGAATPAQSGTSSQFQRSFPSAGPHSVRVTAVDVDNMDPTYVRDYGDDSQDLSVQAGVSGTISVAPDPPHPNEQARLSVAYSGGNGQAPYTYAWDSNNDGSFDDGTTSSIYTTFTTVGPHVVRVRIRDSANPYHEGVVTRTINVEAPAPPPPGSPPQASPPPPPPCLKEFHFALSQFRTAGCFQKIGSSPDQWVTSDQVRLNGISFADNGQRFVITGPTSAEPGGHIKTDDSAIQIDRFIPFSGSVDWTLPDGKLPDGTQGTIGTLREVAVPSYARLFKLRVGGSIAIKLSVNGDKYSASFPLNLELPPVFTAGPSKFAGGVTGAASVTVDDAGPHYGGLKVSVEDIWVGKLQIKSACFSYVAAGEQSIDACTEPQDVDGTSIACATDANTDRFDGNATVVLPTESETTLSAFGGLANGQVSKLGGLVDNLGTAVPIVPGVFLNRVGIGLCLSPPPFKLRGDVGVNALGGQLIVNGHITYTDATDYSPWRVDAGGNVSFRDTLLGDASVGFNAWGDVDFDVNAGMSLPAKQPGATEDPVEVASLNGNINGWLEPRNRTFNLQGTIQGCIVDVKCATATALVSSTGVAGCLDLGSITIPLPDKVEWNKPSFGFVTITTQNKTYTLRGGLGYRYGSSVDLLGNSCDLSAYAATRSSSARAARVGLSERIGSGARAVSLRIHGTNGPPKVVVRGPGGTRIVSPTNRSGLQRKGRFTLAENASNGTTSVLLIKPAAGLWTVDAAPGARSTPTRLDRANFQAPSVLFGQLRQRGADREVEVAYSVPAGASVKLVERAKGVSRTLANSLRGKRCRGTGRLPDGRTVRCVTVRFRPSRGPGGERHVQAIVTRAGVPLAQKNIATFRAQRPALPARPRPLRARRSRGSVVVQFAPVPGVSRYTVAAQLSDGRKLGFDLKSSCRAVRIADVPAGVAAKVEVAGVRYDLAVGARRSISLAAGVTTAGKPTRPRDQWRALEPCT